MICLRVNLRNVKKLNISCLSSFTENFSSLFWFFWLLLFQEAIKELFSLANAKTEISSKDFPFYYLIYIPFPNVNICLFEV